MLSQQRVSRTFGPEFVIDGHDANMSLHSTDVQWLVSIGSAERPGVPLPALGFEEEEEADDLELEEEYDEDDEDFFEDDDDEDDEEFLDDEDDLEEIYLDDEDDDT